ncbi:hypothetical protein Pmar_PMAR006051 [Perkinsus marinus ATCC 50983]|uniref:Uncharacterized protein n=1 Tax=Perkinsus marinus (strain ATCC 50983 / TXsc) TaxID=423536 RepID=C5LA30_PERM5|nr:hypothetical protein Pmar_PMAR006051 [Perkinsus marinus ATCC 50983]EER06286.1 hypothetical protein Pmar_PMAR006051 [Perkinsus marinus ATCC 50983]|eukprot:XP_002774470.1 hypothetical protein Pmar_PMAR006051 [Perkinsus marinus ATCC 50983]
MRFVTEPFVIVVGGSDIDISESEMVTRDSPPELVQSQRHRAAVKLTVQKAQRPSALSADSIKSPLCEGLSRVTLKPHSPDIKFWQVLLRLHISATSPDPEDRAMELLLRIRLGEIDHAQIS